MLPKAIRPVLIALVATSGAPAAVGAAATEESLAIFQHVSYAKLSGAPGDISHLARDDDGFLWIQGSRGAFRFDGKVFDAQAAPSRLLHPSDAADADGNVWWVAGGQLWVKASGTRLSSRVADVPLNVREVAIGHDRRVYIRTDDGVRFFQRTGAALEEIAATISDRQVNGLLESRTGALWITRTTGVLHASREALDAAERSGDAPRTETFGRINGLTGAFPDRMLEDDAGDIWIGTEGGLDVFRRTPFTPVSVPEGIHQINAETDSRGTTWVGSDHMPLLRIDGSGTHPVPGPRSGTRAMALDLDTDVIWAGGDEGIWRLADDRSIFAARLPYGGREQKTALVAVPPTGKVIAAYEPDAHGATLPLKMWAAAQWQSLPSLPSLPLTAAEAPGGVIWIGLSGGPAVALLAHGAVTVLGPERGLATGPVRAIVPDHGGVWVGGDLGIQFYDGSRFRSLPTERPDLLYWVTGMVVDRAGFLWVQTSALVFRSRNPIAGAQSTSQKTAIRFDRFDYVDGIPGGADPDRGLPSLRMSADGRVWAKTVAGLAWIDPASYPTPRIPATPRIDGIDVRGERRPAGGDTVRLGGDEKDIAIHFTVAELSRPDQVRFQYRLRPATGTWVDAGESREVVLTQIPPGHTTFEVRALIGSHASVKPAVLRVFRAATFGETAWPAALTGAVVACIVALILALRMRSVTRRLRIRAEEREALARDIHDTLLQRFQGAMLTLQALATRSSIPADEQLEIARIADETKDVIVAGRERIQRLRGAPDAGVKLYDHLLSEGQRLAATHGQAYTLTLTGRPRPIRDEVAVQLAAIAMEAMTNAFVHSQGSRVDVTVSYEADGLWLTVADDGRGFDPGGIESASSTRHFGLRGMRERAATLAGSLRLESAPNEGAEVHVRVPRKTAFV